MDIQGLGGDALSVIIMIVALVVICALMIGLVWLYLWYKKYAMFDCVIWERDGFGQLYETRDKAGIFVDKKTNLKLLFLRKNKVGLDPNNIPYIPSKNVRTVYLFRRGLKNFSFIKPVIGEKLIQIKMGEEDVNWGINAYERQKKLLSQNMLLQYMPFIMIVFVTVIILIIFIYFFKGFGDLKEFGVQMYETAKLARGAI